MNNHRLKKELRAALFCAITAVASQIILPIAPVPFSFSLVAVFLTGGLLDSRTALFSQTAYILLGAVGAPVFSGFSGGLAKLAGPTGGYLLAYPLMAYIISALREKWGKSGLKTGAAMALSLLVCYALGMGQLMLISNIGIIGAFMSGVAPFILFDLLKIVLAVTIARSLRNVIQLQS